MTFLKTKTVIFLLLTLATLLFVASVERYRPVGEELLLNPDFRLGLQDWQARGPAGAISLLGNGRVELLSDSSRHTVDLAQTIRGLESSGHLQLSAKLSSEAVVPGTKGWHRARLVLVRYAENDRWLKLLDQVAALTGDTDWRRFRKTFRLEEQAVKTQVVLQLPHVTGRLRAGELSLRRALLDPLFTYGQVAAFLLWGGFLLALLRPYLQRRSGLVRRFSLVLVTATLFVGVLLPGTIKTELSGEIVQVSRQVKLQLDANIEPDLLKKVNSVRQLVGELDFQPSKAGHFVLFALLFMVLGLTRGELMLFEVYYDVLLLAATTELLQLFLAGRTPLVTDIFIDMAGALLGLLLLVLLRKVGAVNNLRA